MAYNKGWNFFRTPCSAESPARCGRRVDPLKRLKLSPRGAAAGAISLLCCCLITTNSLLYAGKKNIVLLFAVTLAFSLCCARFWDAPGMKKYRTRGRLTAVSAVALYAAFASWGQRLLHMDAPRMYITWDTVVYLLIGAVWYVPLLLCLLAGLEWLVTVNPRPRSLRRPPRWKVQLALMLLFCAVQCVFLYSFWPGGYGNDGVYLMQQVAGDAQLNDWHPSFYVLTLRFFWTLAGRNTAIFPALQLGLFAWLLTDFLMLGYDCGLQPKTLAVCGLIFLVLPNQVYSCIGIVKDEPFTMTLLWAFLLLYRLKEDP